MVPVAAVRQRHDHAAARGQTRPGPAPSFSTRHVARIVSADPVRQPEGVAPVPHVGVHALAGERLELASGRRPGRSGRGSPPAGVRPRPCRSQVNSASSEKSRYAGRSGRARTTRQPIASSPRTISRSRIGALPGPLPRRRRGACRRTVAAPLDARSPGSRSGEQLARTDEAGRPQARSTADAPAARPARSPGGRRRAGPRARRSRRPRSCPAPRPSPARTRRPDRGRGRPAPAPAMTVVRRCARRSTGPDRRTPPRRRPGRGWSRGRPPTRSTGSCSRAMIPSSVSENTNTVITIGAPEELPAGVEGERPDDDAEGARPASRRPG